VTRTIPLLVALAGVLAFASTGGAAAHARLVGTTGPGFSIEMAANGKDVKKLKPGTYTLVVHDKASFRDFHLIGPGVNKVVTSVEFVGTKTVTVRLKKGKYTYQCDPHASSGMRGSFVVG
jgi:plastocyanin